MSEQVDSDRDELAGALRGLARRVQGLVRFAPPRAMQPQRMRHCLIDILTLLEAATDLLFHGESRPPTLHRGDDGATSGENADMQGTTKGLSVSEVIDVLGTCEKSGLLKVVNATETFSIQFQKGSVVHASSDNSPPGQRLGDILIDRGFITAEEFTRFLARSLGTGERIGVALERGELVTREQLAVALERQIQFLFNRLFATTEATFTFHEQTAGGIDNRVRMSAMQLLLESARAQDEALR